MSGNKSVLVDSSLWLLWKETNMDKVWNGRQDNEMGHDGHTIKSETGRNVDHGSNVLIKKVTVH